MTARPLSRVGSADGGTLGDQPGRGGSIPTPALGKAWQRTIRERRARDDSDANLFGRWWEGLDLDLKAARVREISQATAKKIIVDYEWLGTMPAVAWHCFGIYFDGHLGGVSVFGPEYGENLGIWDRYGYTGRIILLARGACAHWSPPNTASRLTRAAIRLLPPRYAVITATVDPDAGEAGTIYQACGFDYLGLMTLEGRILAGRSPYDYRTVGIVGGKVMQSRSVRAAFGRFSALPREMKGRAKYKGRYITFRGPDASTLRAAISNRVRPHVRRGVA